MHQARGLVDQANDLTQGCHKDNVANLSKTLILETRPAGPANLVLCIPRCKLVS